MKRQWLLVTSVVVLVLLALTSAAGCSAGNPGPKGVAGAVLQKSTSSLQTGDTVNPVLRVSGEPIVQPAQPEYVVNPVLRVSGEPIVQPAQQEYAGITSEGQVNPVVRVSGEPIIPTAR